MKNCSALLIFLLFLQPLLFSQQWEEVASYPVSDIHHSFGFALNGKGYSVTGSNTDIFYEYDPLTDQWTELDDFPGTPRGYAIGDIWDGKAYFGFGREEVNYLNDLWVFDPDNLTWTQLASCPCDGRSHPAFVAHNGQIFMGMGGNSSGSLNDWWVYDMATDTWTEGAGFPGLERHHPFQFGIGDYVYAGFGHGGPNIFNDWYRYNPATDQWDQMASLPAEGRVAGTQFAWEGMGFVLSGDGDDHSSMDTGEFWYYEPELDQWTELPPHPGISRWAPASFVLDNEVYIFSGIPFGGFEEETYKFDLTTVFPLVSVDPDQEKDGSIVTVYPNPFSGHLQLDIPPAIRAQPLTVILHDIRGRQLFETADGPTTLDLSFLPKGSYYLTVRNNTFTSRQMVVKF